MIRHLHIENYALIQHLDIDFHPGFSVITGETGAGKSIIIGAIGLLMGQRADSRTIKAGAKRCVVEIEMNVADYGMETFFEEADLDYDEGCCIIRREVTAAGKSRAFINDTPVSLSLLKEIGEMLIDVHSQHKNLLLGKEDFQISTLDLLAKNDALLDSYKRAYSLYRQTEKELEEAVAMAKQSQEEEDYLRFQYEQIAEAELQENEQEELEEELQTLEHAEDIKSTLFSVVRIMQSDGESADALNMLRQGIHELRSISSVYSQADAIADRMDSCYIELKDVAGELEDGADSVEYNPKRQEQVSERLNTIYTLEKKHGVDSVCQLLELQHALGRKLSAIDGSGELIERLRCQVEENRRTATSLALQLSAARAKAAEAMEAEMRTKLLPLGMPNAQFRCEVVTDEQTLTPKGCDQVQFLFNANKSGELKPVSQVASGGEIARVMLSVKALIAGAVKLPTIIFDEIDTGVSGKVAEKMAIMMREMGNQNRQVISITHLPQIAAHGQHHYKVYKEDTEDTTLSHIVPLVYEQRVEELAHMLSGEDLTQAAIDNARALIENSSPSAMP
ncbi:MAG: DNA repair protein RecN [Bacteroidaceae bacterium]|nr:DNA repair protein RecN [Bacteroidaceae bacterium]